MNTRSVGTVDHSQVESGWVSVTANRVSSSSRLKAADIFFPNELPGKSRPVENCSSLERAESQRSNKVYTTRIWIDSLPNRQIMSSFYVVQYKLFPFVLFLNILSLVHTIHLHAHNQATTAHTEIKNLFKPLTWLHNLGAPRNNSNHIIVIITQTIWPVHNYKRHVS